MEDRLQYRSTNICYIVFGSAELYFCVPGTEQSHPKLMNCSLWLGTSPAIYTKIIYKNAETNNLIKIKALNFNWELKLEHFFFWVYIKNHWQSFYSPDQSKTFENIV